MGNENGIIRERNRSNLLTSIMDANGKEFSIDVSKLFDVNGDGDGIASKVSDSAGGVIIKQAVKICDSNGTILEDATTAIADLKAVDSDIVAIDVYCEGTHSGDNHNYCTYTSKSMENDRETFLSPYQRPVLKNHNEYSGEPLGRIKESTFGPSEIVMDRDAIDLTLRITDRDAMEKFLDGRYTTFSISGSMGSCTCGICGKQILKDGNFKFCGHMKGNTYQNKVCYWTAEDITYCEISVVNNPADDFAQVKRIAILRKDSGMQSQQGKEGSKDMANVSAEDANIMDSVLGTKEGDLGDTGSTANDGTGGEPTPAIKDQDEGEKSLPVEDQLTEALQKVESLKADMEAKDAVIAEKEETIKTLTAEKDVALADATNYKNKVVKLATLNKQMIVDGIVELELTSNKLEDAAIEARKVELMSKSVVELNTTKDAWETSTGLKRTPASVKNPSLASDSEKKQEIIKDGEEKKVKQASRTIDDCVNSIVNKLLK